MSSTITALTSGGGLAMAGDTSGQLELKTNNGTTAVTIDTSQNVGIGTASPSSYGKFVVAGTGGNTIASVVDSNASRLTNSAQGAGGALTQYYKDLTPTYVAGVGSFSPATNTAQSALVFSDYQGGWTERMRIDASGNLLINSTSNGGNGKFYISNTNDCMKTFTSGSSGFGIVCQTAYTSSNGNLLAFVNSGGGIVGTITTNNSNTAYNTSSDYRLKENIAPMTGCLDKVSKLKPVTYRWKESGLESEGFIAHELQAIVPDCVTGEKDAVDAEGKPVYQGIDTSFLVATLTAAIQELNAKVEAQAATITALQAKVGV